MDSKFSDNFFILQDKFSFLKELEEEEQKKLYSKVQKLTSEKPYTCSMIWIPSETLQTTSTSYNYQTITL